MHQFFNGNDAAYTHLEQRAEIACVRYKNREMPPGTEPNTAAVGFEVQSSNGIAKLYVEKGLIYFGSSDKVRRWFSDGVIEFPSFDALKSWLKNSLAELYTAADPENDSAGQSLLETVTDLAAVEINARDDSTSNSVNEKQLSELFYEIVRGQEFAIKVLSRELRHQLARTEPSRPLTVFATGPTGVGKTLSAESIPEVLKLARPIGSDYGYLRLDMNEYQERYRLSQLLGSPQGYVGYGDGAQLVDALSKNPQTIVLFDEIEKAHPDVLQALMNAMDAGRLSTASDSGNGRVIDCRKAIFFFTSNLNADDIVETIEQQDLWGNDTAVDGVCRRSLSAAGMAPELVGRIRTFLVFRPLADNVKAEIMTLGILSVASEYGVEVRYIEPEIITSLLREKPVDSYGARPYEYLAGRVLGSVFANAAQQGHTQGITLCYNNDRQNIGYTVRPM